MSHSFDFPTKIQIQTHNLCNYACKMCPYPSRSEHKLRQMKEELLGRLLDELNREQRSVQLCLMLQNEPLLDPRFLSLLRKAHENELVRSIYTVTNGSRLTESLLDELTSYPRFSLTVSINALDPRRYLEVHGRDRYARIERTLESWSGDRSRVAVSCVVDRGNVDLARRFRDHYSGLGYGVRLLPVTSRAGSQTSQPLLHEPDLGFGHCSYPVDTLTVRWDGQVLLCCQDWVHEETFGDLSTTSVRDVWNAPRMRSVREAALRGTLRRHEPCKTCDVPISSIERIRMERLLTADHTPLPQSPGAILPHTTWLRSSGRPPVAAVVRSIDAGARRIVADCQNPPGDAEVMLLLPIGCVGGFSSTKPSQLWCRAKVHASSGDKAELVLEPCADDPAHELLEWYESDWTIAERPQPSQATAAHEPA